MATLSTLLRRQLESAIREARTIADDAAGDAVARLAIAASEAPSYLSEEQKALRRRLRAHARSLGDRRDPDGTMETARLAEATAYEHWHRMLFGRFLVERNLLIHPTLGVPLSRGELKELADEEGLTDEWALVERLAAPSLPAVFKPDDPVLELELAPEFQVPLRALVASLAEEVFAADDSLGWTYQFWRAAEKKAVNEKQVKIGADELPAVTQLFTEPYMVKFLLHNTLGAWWAGKVLAADPDLARDAADEPALRAACALPGVDWEYLRFVRASREPPSPTQPLRAGSTLSRTAGEGADVPSAEAGEGDSNDLWRPAAGTFPGWPERAAEITYLDPCCGSGHFLVEAFGILAALRRDEETLSPEEAARAVLRDNLHGLEIDGRCVQIAAFNVALAAWRIAGGPVSLPVPHIAWVGAPPPLPKSEFVALANGDTELERGLTALHDLFQQAPLLGSLIELTGGDLVDPTRIARLDQSIAALVEKMRNAEPERAEGALAARGMADAAAILSRRFTLVATNVPFLGRGEQCAQLTAIIDARFHISRQCLSTTMLQQISALLADGGSAATVTKQEWCFLVTYTDFRRWILEALRLEFLAFLGEEAWESFNKRGPLATLTSWSKLARSSHDRHFAIDATHVDAIPDKISCLLQGSPTLLLQEQQLRNPDCRITAEPGTGLALLSNYAHAFQGISTGDVDRFRRCFWELADRKGWASFRSTVSSNTHFGGCEHAVYWGEDGTHLAAVRGEACSGKIGVAVSQMRHLPVCTYLGERFDGNVAAIIPHNAKHLGAILEYCLSAEYKAQLKRIDKKKNITNATLVKVPFDLAHWQKIAAEKYPNGLPQPYSDDPTQWLFHRHPRYAEPGTELHVALARLAGNRWPAETDTEMRLSAEARVRIAEAATLPEADADGLLPLEAVIGERPLGDRLRAYCTAAWGDAWTQGSEAALIASACERFKDKPPRQLTFDAWLRSHAARQHAKLFHDRPFLWWISDGRADGFTVVAHYHRLGHGNLERLTYTMLGDWIARLGDDPRAEAARMLQQKLALILEGEKPYDIFVRWKPLGRQPLGWDPDLDDGVRLNIRPFVEAGVLAYVPNVKYTVDRGKDVASGPWYHLFHGERRNDHHTSLAEKRAARTEAAE